MEVRKAFIFKRTCISNYTCTLVDLTDAIQEFSFNY